MKFFKKIIAIAMICVFNLTDAKTTAPAPTPQTPPTVIVPQSPPSIPNPQPQPAKVIQLPPSPQTQPVTSAPIAQQRTPTKQADNTKPASPQAQRKGRTRQTPAAKTEPRKRAQAKEQANAQQKSQEIQRAEQPTKPTNERVNKNQRNAPAPKPEPHKPRKPTKKTTTQPIIQLKEEPLQKVVTAGDRFITNNIVMTLDPRLSETVEKGGTAVVQQALIALYQKAAPVLMTTNIFEIIIAMKEQIGDQELQKLRTMGYQQLFNYANQLMQKIRIPGASSFFIILLSGINFDNQNMNCYFHTTEKLVLLIPKQYIQANMPQALNRSLQEQAQICGFNSAVLTPVANITAANLMQQIQVQKAKPTVQDQFVPNLTAIFAMQKKNDVLISPQQTSRWLIYIVGHGGPANLTIGTVRDQLKMIKQSVENGRRALAMGAQISAAQRNQAQQYVNEYEPRLKEYEKMVEGRSGWQNSQLVPESALIAGMTAPQFADLMTFFDEGIDTAYVHYITCFSGGSNQTYINETLTSQDVHFIASTQGIHEGYVSAGIGMGTRSDKPGIQITGQDFAEFFRLLRMFFTQQEQFVKLTGDKGKDPILFIIQTLSSDTKEQNQPFVRFPGAGSFVATPLTKKTKTLTKTVVKAHEIEKNPIDIEPDVNVLIVNTPRINVPLNLGKKRTDGGHTAIVFPSPPTFQPAYEGIEIFKEINWQDTVQSLLFNLSYLNTRMFTQTFVVNTLGGILLQQSGLQSSGKIQNFIMQLRGVPGNNFAAPQSPSMQLSPVTPETIRAGQVGTNIQICFELNDTIYQTMYAIRNIEQTDELASNIARLTFTATPKKSANMNTIAATFLTAQEIAKVAKPITLESIADFVNDKLDAQDPSMAIWSDADLASLQKFAEQHVK